MERVARPKQRDTGKGGGGGEVGSTHRLIVFAVSEEFRSHCLLGDVPRHHLGVVQVGLVVLELIGLFAPESSLWTVREGEWNISHDLKSSQQTALKK
jgi:hypothetical protein